MTNNFRFETNIANSRLNDKKEFQNIGYRDMIYLPGMNFYIDSKHNLYINIDDIAEDIDDLWIEPVITTASAFDKTQEKWIEKEVRLVCQADTYKLVGLSTDLVCQIMAMTTQLFNNKLSINEGDILSGLINTLLSLGLKQYQSEKELSKCGVRCDLYEDGLDGKRYSYEIKSHKHKSSPVPEMTKSYGKYARYVDEVIFVLPYKAIENFGDQFDDLTVISFDTMITTLIKELIDSGISHWSIRKNNLVKEHIRLLKQKHLIRLSFSLENLDDNQ